MPAVIGALIGASALGLSNRIISRPVATNAPTTSARRRCVSAGPTSTVPGIVQKKASGIRYSQHVSEDEVMALELTDAIAGVAGVLDVEAALRHTDCPVAPELFRLAG